MSATRRPAKIAVVGLALAVALYGTRTSAEPANYILWGLIFVALLLDP